MKDRVALPLEPGRGLTGSEIRESVRLLFPKAYEMAEPARPAFIIREGDDLVAADYFDTRTADCRVYATVWSDGGIDFEIGGLS